MEFHEYPKIYHLGHDENKEIFNDPEDEIIIEEKLDGGNFRVFINDGKIIFGSHTQELGDETTEINGNWKRCVAFIKDKLLSKDLSKYNSLILYGECMIKHSMSYDWEKIPPFLGFDVMQNDKFLNYNYKIKIFNDLDLPIVPLIQITKAGCIKKINDDAVPISVYSPQKAEGLVYKNYNKQIFGKYVRAQFKEIAKEHFGSSKRFAENDTERVVAIYCTNQRIDKIIFKLIDEGNKLDMSLMPILWKRVHEDILEENYKEIGNSSWIINYKEVKTLVAKRCAAVLKQVMVNNALNNENNN